MTSLVHQDSIAAIATAPGRGGVGIIRISGSKALSVAQAILGYEPKPRYAHYGPFKASDGTVLDEGIALYFPNPHSFTGEDVVEFQGHGGPVVLDIFLKEFNNYLIDLSTYVFMWKRPWIFQKKKLIFYPMVKFRPC